MCSSFNCFFAVFWLYKVHASRPGVFSAVWSDPDELKREACWTVDQGGLPSGWHAACWPFIYTKHKFIMYGAYPSEELWRVNLSVLLGIAGSRLCFD